MSKSMGEDKTFLECMLNDLDNIHEGDDEHIRNELIEMGIDIEKAKKSFLKALTAAKLRREAREASRDVV